MKRAEPAGQADSAPSDDALPSHESAAPWVYVEAPPAVLASRTERSGKWMVFVERSEVDAWWERIARDVRAGTLGPSAKVSTCAPRPEVEDPIRHSLIVYTADHDDERDVMRVREGLRRLGVTWPIAYKTDDATRAGLYRRRGDRHVSKYWE
jgi:hypothetical protein